MVETLRLRGVILRKFRVLERVDSRVFLPAAMTLEEMEVLLRRGPL